jgi:hypothetical protein
MSVILYGRANSRSPPVGLLSPGSIPTLEQYAYGLGIVSFTVVLKITISPLHEAIHCVEQFRYGPPLTITLSERNYGALAEMLKERVMKLANDEQLTARRLKLGQAATHKLNVPTTLQQVSFTRLLYHKAHHTYRHLPLGNFPFKLADIDSDEDN